MTSERYKIENGLQIIEIKVSDVKQLFDLRDPAPFREKDLDENFTRYLEAYTDEVTTRYPLKIKIGITNLSEDVTPNIIKEAIRQYFEYQILLKRSQLTKNMKTAQLFLLIGISLLFFCLVVAQWIHKEIPSNVGTTLREGVVIFGWVSMWKPIELLLFDWYPIYDRIRVYRRLSEAKTEVEFERR
ncbi:hypothetical protein [Bdellovibrio sp. NC01]|uniref:hypothetical protein n=1 Tax=Bdellovibrio sp. NC01 TaxID=2220073 RepID=UPI0011594EEE|nr:hypothetical protein [Bdellovibrio sp. NC01]QDK36461.1 hypothetical protein DOE51_02025 [Bdellovibrio sp. NC01]